MCLFKKQKTQRENKILQHNLHVCHQQQLYNRISKQYKPTQIYPGNARRKAGPSEG